MGDAALRPAIVRGALAAAAVAAMLISLHAGQQPSACSAELDALERAVRLDPDNLFTGADYRQAAIRCEAFDRTIDFFKRVTKVHGGSLNARLNLAFAYVDKLPASGDVRQALLGRDAAGEFEKANAIKPTWVAHYTRGFIYLNYPRVFRVARTAIAELEQAIALAADEPRRPHHARAWVALGDAHYWRFSELAKAREVWAEGVARFPDDEALRERMSKEGMPLRDAIRKTMSPDVRVDTSLAEFRQKG